MSVKVMGAVWDSALPRDEKFVALSYADHASHDGTNVYPSVGRMAWKTGYTTRSIQIITKKLVDRGVLVPDGIGPGGVNKYYFSVDALPVRDDFIPDRAKNIHPKAGGEEISGGGEEISQGGEETSPEPSYNRQYKHTPTPPPDDVQELVSAIASRVRNRFHERSEGEFKALAMWLHDQGATPAGVNSFCDWFEEYDDAAPWLKNFYNDWPRYTSGKPPVFAKRKKKDSGASKQEQLEALKVIARKGTRNYKTEIVPAIAEAGLTETVKRMGKWRDIVQLNETAFRVKFYQAWGAS